MPAMQGDTGRSHKASGWAWSAQQGMLLAVPVPAALTVLQAVQVGDGQGPREAQPGLAGAGARVLL